jgi:glyoxylase-like metal-dependent hydrolase (beta-lactamase superfamily II)
MERSAGGAFGAEAVPSAPTEVLPGVHRLGSSTVNWYFVEDEGRVTVVDAGVPGYWDQLEPALESIGRGLGDVAALVLTHAHSDHTGVAGPLHDRGVPVMLHAADHELMRTGKEPWKRERKPFPQILRPGVWVFFVHMMRNGALKPPKITDPQAIADGDALDVPGRPRVLHTPGHTPGHCVFHFEGRRALFTGDLLCTWNPLTGRRGPQIMPAAFNVSSDECFSSLGRIESLEVDAVLPGHGEPWTDGARTAVAAAREAGKS